MAIFQRQIEQTIADVEIYWFVFSVTAQANVFLGTNRVFERLPLNTPADLAVYRERLGEYPQFVARMEAKLAGQAERGILLPEEAVGPIVATIRQYVQAPPDSPFSVTTLRLSKIEDAAAERFQQEVSRAIVADVNPALTRLADYLDGPLRRRRRRRSASVSTREGRKRRAADSKRDDYGGDAPGGAPAGPA